MKKTTQAVMLGLCLSGAASVQAASKPNIIYILADDLGYGDVKCLNPERCKIATPHMDRLAAEGMTFTDAHTSSSVCTPTRYGIMTGRYNWRSELQAGVLNGYRKPLIPTDRLTVPALLKQNGYNTAMIGKWHLGLDIATINGKPAAPASKRSLIAKKNKGAFPPEQLSNIDWKGTIQGGPVDLGFDSWFGITASLDFPPYVWIRDRNWQAEGSHAKGFNRPGPAAPDFEAVDVLDKLQAESVKFISEYQSDKPFFIYLPLPSPHTPIVPSDEWKGKSSIGIYGDYVMQTDGLVGEVLKALDARGLVENTIVIMTADNGCSKAAGQNKKLGIATLEAKGHYPSAQFRGSKADLWDGGHRVPFIVRWPKGIKAGTESDQTICLTDLMATCADLSGGTVPETAGEDSVSFLPAFTGKPIVSTRAGIIHHGIDGHFAYRKGKWKLLLAKGSGGWTAPMEAAAIKAGAEIAQLYDMEADPGETTNLYSSHPEIAKQLLQQLEEDIARGRSTAGSGSENDFKEIVLWKSGQE